MAWAAATWLGTSAQLQQAQAEQPALRLRLAHREGAATGRGPIFGLLAGNGLGAVTLGGSHEKRSGTAGSISVTRLRSLSSRSGAPRASSMISTTRNMTPNAA